MTHILYPPARPQSVGEILDTGFRIFTRTLVKCLPYAVAAVILRQLPNLYLVARGQGLATLRALTSPSWLVLDVVGILIGLLLISAILLRQYALATGHP